MEAIVKMIDKIKNFFKKKRKLVVVNLSSKDLTENQKLEEVKNEATYWKVKWAKDFSKKQQEKESDVSKKKEEEKIKFLIEQEKDLKKKEFESVNLFKVFKKIQKQKKGKKLVFTTFDGKKVLGSVDAIGFSPTGLIECASGGKVIWAGTRLKDVFYWVAGLSTYISKGIIPLCVDEHGRFSPNIMQEEIPQYVRTGDGKFIINRTNTKEVSKYVADLNEDIAGLQSELESTEETVGEQQKEIHEKERETKLHKDRADKIHSELSMALQKVSELSRVEGVIVRQNTVLTTLKETQEELIEKLEGINKRLFEKLEDALSETTRDKVAEDIKATIQFAKDNLGNITQVLQPKEERQSLVEGVRPVKV